MPLSEDLQKDNAESLYFTVFGWSVIAGLYIGFFTLVHKKTPEYLPHIWQCASNTAHRVILSIGRLIDEEQEPPAPAVRINEETPDPAKPANDPLHPLHFNGFKDDPFPRMERIYEVERQRRRRRAPT